MKYYYFFSIYISSLLFFSLSLNSQFNSIEDESLFALTKFYESTNGDQWLSKENWNTNPCYCQWEHISCIESSNCTGSVDILDFELNNLSGTIPSELFLLKQVRGIIFSQNLLSGTLPSEIGLLSRLERIELDKNGIEGTLPTEIGRCTNLYFLVINENYFLGKVPSELGSIEWKSWSKLTTFSVAENMFYGKLLDTPIFSWSKLTTLDLSFNQFSDSIPIEFGNLPLKSLKLRGNVLNGTIPIQMLKYPLEYLDLSLNLIEGTIPPEIFSVSTLQTILVSHNRLSGTLPQKSTIQQTKLDISHNQIQGTLPEILITNCSDLYFSQNNISGTLPPSLKIISFIEGSFNHLTGPLPTDMTNALEIFLNSNHLSGTLPVLLNTRILDLHDNQLEGEISPILTQNIAQIRLSRNRLNGTIPPEFFSPFITNFDISENEFTGTIPSSLFRSKLLSELRINNNQFSGTLPPIIGDSRQLETLILSNNLLNGTIPSSLSDCRNLVHFDIHNNLFYGPLIELPYSQSLSVYDLSYNKFYGSLPTFNQSNLQLFSVSGNSLSGTIPTSFQLLTNLKEFRLENNHLTGVLPKGFGQLNKLQVLELGANQFEGEIDHEIFQLSDLRYVQLSSNRFSFSLMNTVLRNQPRYTVRMSGNQFPCPLPQWCSEWENGGNGACIPCISTSDSNTNQLLKLVLIVVFMIIFITSILLILYSKRYRVSKTRVLIPEQDIELLELIGEGAFGRVYKASWRGTTFVAVKELKSSETQQLPDSEIESFLAEAELLTQLAPHPNIVQFLGLVRSKGNRQEIGNLKIVTEFLSDGNLSSFLRKRFHLKSSLQNRYRFFLELSKGIAAGMDHLSGANIIHRDLAARNILIQLNHETSEENINTHSEEEFFDVTPKISDFGLSGAKSVFHLPIKWTAPEVLDDPTHASTKSDVWSFGIVLYEIITLCRKRLYEPFTNSQVVSFVRERGKLSKPSYCPPGFYEIMFSCWSFLPEARPTFQRLFLSLEVELQEFNSNPPTLQSDGLQSYLSMTEHSSSLNEHELSASTTTTTTTTTNTIQSPHEKNSVIYSEFLREKKSE